MSHARLSPSAAKRWTTCPASVKLIDRLNLPDKDSVDSALGTAAHELLENSLIGLVGPKRYKGTFLNMCKVKPEGFEVDADMIEAVTVAWEFTMGELDKGFELFTERKVDAGSMFGRTDCKGTADITLISETAIKIYDYKNGAGIFVEVKDNQQALLYAIGALSELSEEQRAKLKYVEIGIIQPRIECKEGPIRAMRYSVVDILAWAKWFGIKAAITDQDDAPFKAGTEQCMFCPVKRKGCPEMRDTTIKVLKIKDLGELDKGLLRGPETLTKEETLQVLQYAEVAIQFFKSVMGNAQASMIEGEETFEGFKLVHGKRGNKKFEPEQDVMVKKLTSSFGLKKVELLADPKLLGVAKILKLAKKSEKYSDEKYAKLEELITQPAGKLTMAPESDPRPSASQVRIDQAFKDIPLSENS